MRLVFAAVIAVAAASAQSGFTFCVAEAGDQVWITDVFSSSRARERLEADVVALLRARGFGRAVAQCPQPQTDKEEAFNAQFTAAEFHRKLGQTLRVLEMPASAR